jgi:hypothetical protein
MPRRIICMVHVSRMGEMKNEYRVMVGNYRGKKAFVESILR